MAIVKMKHLRLVAMREDREELLHLLQRMGCVEIDEPRVDETDPLVAELTRPDGEGLAAAEERHSAGEQALTILNRYAPKKGGLLQGRPTLTEAELFEAQSCAQARQTVESINETQRDIAILQAQRTKLLGQQEVLAPWLPLDLPLDTQSTRDVVIQLGTLPASVDLQALEGELRTVSELAQLTLSSSSREYHYLLLMCHVSAEDAVMELLKDRGWSRANLRDWTGTAAENQAVIDQHLGEIAEKLKESETYLTQQGPSRESVCQDIDRAAVDVERESARGRLLETRQTFLMEGWVLAESWEKLQVELERYPCAFQAEDPEKEEYAEVPVKLKNNWLTRPMNMITEMYSLPAYGSLDPNPLMAPFFILFYGIMMADMGYGLLMMIASLVVIKRTKPKGPSTRHLFPLLGLCGASTFLVGMMTGSFFGDMIPQIAMMCDPNTSLTSLPHLFTPLDDALAILMGSLVLGVVQILTGMTVSFVRQIRDGQTMDALCNEGAWFGVFLSIGVGAALGYAKYGVIAALVILALTQGHGKTGIMGKLLGIGGSLYNNITGYFSDILSYSRLMALMLAGSVIAMVFNTLGAITGNVFFFILISMVGNVLNFALNLLGCFVHDMRLQCLEYFGRFYQDGGKPFKPVEMNTTYVDIKPQI